MHSESNEWEVVDEFGASFYVTGVSTEREAIARATAVEGFRGIRAYAVSVGLSAQPTTQEQG